MPIANNNATRVAGDMVEGAEGALETYLPAILDVPASALVHKHTGVDRAIRLGLEASISLAPYVARLTALPGITPEIVELLNGVSKALYFAVGERRRSRRDRRRLNSLLMRGYKARNKLSTLSKLLVIAEKLAEDMVPSLDGGNGHLALSSDVTDLAEMFETHFPDLDVGNLLTEVEIKAMKSLGGQLYSAPSKEKFPGQDIDFEETIAKGYTLLKTVYLKLRRAMLFLLEDVAKVDAVIPPFVTERSKRSSGAASASSGEGEIVGTELTDSDDQTGDEETSDAIEVAPSPVASGTVSAVTSEATDAPTSESSTPVASDTSVPATVAEPASTPATPPAPSADPAAPTPCEVEIS